MSMKIGFVGVGCISGIYLKNITSVFREIEIAGLCDLVRERAENAAKQYGVQKVYADMYELFNDPEVDIVLNITRPKEHYFVTKQALLAGKHVYSEKPLAETFEQGAELVALAAEKGLYLGGAPDTFMGAGLQTARHLIDSGFIGTPIGAAAHMISRGPEDWHPDPDFLFKYGAGPLFDMGPYYVTALINMLGRVDKVSGVARKTFETRPILTEHNFGKPIEVEAPTYVSGQLMFESGAVASLFTTFDVNSDSHFRLEIHGTEGTLFAPDPNTFGGEVRILRLRENQSSVMPLIFPYSDNSRALGLADMAKAIETNRQHRANSAQQLHVLEIMSGIYKSSAEEKFIKMNTPYDRPVPVDRTGLTGVL